MTDIIDNMIKKKLHKTQERLLNLLKKHQHDPLTIRDLQEALSLSTTSLVHHHIKQLEKKGYLKRNPNNTNDYQILSAPESHICYVNLYGQAQCGPNGTLLDGNPIDKIPIASRLLSFSSDLAFMVKAVGDSMEPRIFEGDLVIAKKTNSAQNGDIVICMNDNEVMIKKFDQQNSAIILTSLNQNYTPFLAHENFKIEGVVKAVLNYGM